MAWDVILLDEVDEWFARLMDEDPASAERVAGDKASQWKRWYERNIPLAEDRYRRWLQGEYSEERE